jgi:hypothetical protein
MNNSKSSFELLITIMIVAVQHSNNLICSEFETYALKPETTSFYNFWLYSQSKIKNQNRSFVATQIAFLLLSDSACVPVDGFRHQDTVN